MLLKHKHTKKFDEETIERMQFVNEMLHAVHNRLMHRILCHSHELQGPYEEGCGAMFWVLDEAGYFDKIYKELKKKPKKLKKRELASRK